MKIIQVGTNKASDELSQYLISNYDNLDFGLFVEPNILHVEDIKKCYQKYPNIIVENIAIRIPSLEYIRNIPIEVSKEETLTIFYHTKDGPNYPLASCNIDHIYKHMWCPHLQGEDGEIKSFTVPSITLDQLFGKYAITELDWLFLDIEGIDAEILLTTNWKKYNIKRIEFEYIHLGLYENAIFNMLKGMGYNKVNSLHEYDWAFEILD